MMIRFVALKKQRPEVKYTTTLLRRVMSNALELTTSGINLCALISREIK